MAKSSEYKSIATSVSSALLKARLISDKSLVNKLTSALDRSVSMAIKLKKAEEKKKAEEAARREKEATGAG